MPTIIYYLILTVTTNAGVTLTAQWDSYKTLEECELNLNNLGTMLQDHPDIESYGLTCVEGEAL